MKEVEVKARIQDKDEIIHKLQLLECILSDPFEQKDSVFVPTNITEVPTPVGVPVMRIRENGGKYFLTLKIRLSNGLDKYERETQITDPAATRDIILSTGFKPMVSFTKIRQKCKYKKWEICVDEIEGLGNFIEVEEMTEDGDSENIQSTMFDFLKSLGIKDEDREHHGYDALIWQNLHKKT